MRGFVDLHCHWIAGIDDGARTPEASVAMLRGLKRAGFDTVMATPHMRPGMFDNDRAALQTAFEGMHGHLAGQPDLPAVLLASEHFFDEVVFTRLVQGEGLPYPDLAPAGTTTRKRGVLVELPPQAFPAKIERRFFDLSRAGLRPVLAHPERYQPVWKDDRCLDPLLDAGACLLLDVCALVGKYGRAAQKAAEKLLDDQAYEAACSDAHRPEDADVTADAIAVLEKVVGVAEAERLLGAGPRGILGLGP
ncbi:MAG TPA: CpsB/CapC family capsule biosynthesis tyrosine phosphatase [Labilithrix sp.]|nr:CpsB/CapC family capsule biosynthesis tyrosine phosphatase [Labilithrix sp.]